MTNYSLSPDAESDVSESWNYVASDSLTDAERLLDDLYERFELLADSPLLGRRRPDLGARVRISPVGSYLVIYRPLESGVEVIRVIHGARNYPDLFS